MPPEILFWLSLISKMAITAAFVLAATITAERAGPLVGGLVATLPIAAGPVYVFLALDHDAAFIANSALISFVTNPAIAVFALTYALLAQRFGLSISLGAAFAIWIVLASFLQSLQWTFTPALLLSVVVFPVCLFIARPLRNAPVPRMPGYWYDKVLRALSVALLVASVVALSFRIGPAGTGVLAVFPIVLSSIIVILHRRVGGKAAAAVLANTVLGLVGFGCALATLHLTAIPLGPAIALPIALAVSVGWSLAVLLARKRGIPV